MPARFDDISLTIIMPAFNEAENIVPLIRAALQEIRAHFNCRFLELLVVDDNSPDETWRVAGETGDPAVRVIRRMSDHGLRKSIECGVHEARGDYVLWLDCDFSHPPRFIPQLIACACAGFDITVNSRYVAGGEDVREGKGTWLQRLLSWLLNHLTWLMLGQAFRDYTSGFIAARTAVIRDLGLHGDYGEYFIDLIYRAIRSGYKVLEMPYRNEPRAAGYSKTGSNIFDYARRGIKYIWILFQLRCKGHI